MEKKKTKIAILGIGTVGYGVYKLLTETFLVDEVEVVKILDKDLSKSSLLQGNTKIVTDFGKIVNDEEIKIVIEAMGAENFSYYCIKEALKKRKDVVTANKEVISKHIDELTSLKEENGSSLNYEASVGGGIPIIDEMYKIIRINNVSSIQGILNGTTNFMLTRMFKDNCSFSDSLHIAQEKGFAESDPTADLAGVDMVRKIAILSQIAYHGTINISDIYSYGINNLEDIDVKNIKKMNLSLKLVATSKKIEESNIEISVEPLLVDESSLFYGVSDEFNIVEVDTNINGKLSFIGKGAGRFPTSNAIINDLISILEKQKNYSFKNNNKLSVSLSKDLDKYYLKLYENEDISSTLISEKNNDYIITKEIDRNEFLKIKDKVKFYAKIKGKVK